jgi:hypothetical protein
MPELRKQASGDESKLAIALFSPLIKDAPVDQIKEVLRLVMVKIGLRAQNWPNDLEKVILIQHIQENFGGNALDEIKLAFDMAISGKLDIEPKEVSCYENFSCLYFSKIMSCYREWSADAIYSVPTMPPEQRIFSQQELDDGYREDAERLYQMLKRGFSLKNPEAVKDILVKDKLMSEGMMVINFFFQKMDNGATNIYTKG